MPTLCMCLWRALSTSSEAPLESWFVHVGVEFKCLLKAMLVTTPVAICTGMVLGVCVITRVLVLTLGEPVCIAPCHSVCRPALHFHV